MPPGLLLYRSGGSESRKHKESTLAFTIRYDGGGVTPTTTCQALQEKEISTPRRDELLPPHSATALGMTGKTVLSNQG